MNKDGLLPCPFCARQPTLYKFPNPNQSIWTVTCKCGAESPKDSVSKIGAQRIWNRRRYPFPPVIDTSTIGIKLHVPMKFTPPQKRP